MYLTMLGTGNGFIPGQMDSNALLEENGCKTLTKKLKQKKTTCLN